MTTWRINNKYVFTLNESEGKLFLEAVDKNTKQAWTTQEITEKVASTIIEGLFDDPLVTLSDMIKDAFNGTSETNFVVSLKDKSMEVDITVTFYKKKTRKFTIVLNQKEVTEVFRLEQIIGDLKEEMANLRAEHEAEKRKWSTTVLRGYAKGPFPIPQIQFDAAKIDHLPPGKWLVELSFQVSYANPATGAGWIYYSVLLGNGVVPDCHSGRYVADGAQNGTAYPVSISERYIVDSNGEQALYFQAKPYGNQPTYKNIILTATKID